MAHAIAAAITPAVPATTLADRFFMYGLSKMSGGDKIER
jgi:hypothetical protein